MIKEKERSHVYKTTIKRLREGLQLKQDPVVLQSAPQAVVDTFSRFEPVVAFG